MSADRPANIPEYERWLQREVGYNRGASESYYATVAPELLRAFEASQLWRALLNRMAAFNAEYSDRHGYPLFMNTTSVPELKTKPFKTFLEKTFRENARLSRGWEREPPHGWILPNKYDARINDVVRTTVVVKYLDGAAFLREKIQQIAVEQGIRCEYKNEARFDGGYYAVHAYVYPTLEAISYQAGTETIERSIEIQITTQLKEVIKELVHGYYEERRMRLGRQTDGWAWDYYGKEFTPTY
jgi:hypothetical protein